MLCAYMLILRLNTTTMANKLIADKKKSAIFLMKKLTSSSAINRVPQYLIAAYLGIKPQSLSRLRNEK